MTDNLGVGAMISMLSACDEDAVKRYKDSMGKEIDHVILDTKADPNYLRFVFTDKTGLDLYDDAQSCCENRYMHTDDTLDYYKGTKLMNVFLKAGPDVEDGSGNVHEQMFLEIVTSKGSFTIASHNEHNGYYGGISIRPRVYDVVEEIKQTKKRGEKK